MPAIDWSRSTAFNQATSRPVSWIVDEIIPANTVTLLSSVSGAGKSVLSLHLAVCVMTGSRWLGIETRQCEVAYWDQDNPDSELTENRIVAIAKGLGIDIQSLPPGIIFRAQGPVLDKPDEVLRMRDQLVKRKVGMLVVDTLAAVNPWDEQGIDFSRVITQGLFPFIEAGISPLANHHIGKAHIDHKGQKHNRSGIDAARGHSSLMASVGAAYNLMREGSRRYIECVKPRYGQVAPIQLAYDEDSAMGLPDWKITLSNPSLSLSRQNLTQMIIDNKWESLSSRQIVERAALNGFRISQSTAMRAKVSQA